MNEEESKQSLINEALEPGLSKETFDFCGKTVKIKPLKVRYQIQFAETLKEVAKDIAGQTKEVMTSSGDVISHTRLSEILTLASASLENVKALYQLVAILAENDGCVIDEATWMESDLQPQEAVDILLRFSAKNSEICKPIVDFFHEALPALREGVAAIAAQAKEHLKKLNSKSTA